MPTAHQDALAREDTRVLDPVERVSEVLFGLIMVLTFTGSLSVATAGRADIREMLYGAIGCNLAWGIVDAVMYVMNRVLSRGRSLVVLRALRQTTDAAHARAVISRAVNPHVASLLRPSVFEIRARGSAQGARAASPASAHRRRCSRRPGCVPAGVPLHLPGRDSIPADRRPGHSPPRVEHGCRRHAVRRGVSLGRHSGLRPWLVALAMAVLGAALVALTIALGG